MSMVFYDDNSGAVYLASNWSAIDKARHMETKMFFLRYLKEAGIL